MGKCWKCRNEIILKEEETRCDNCSEIVKYFCWNCKQSFCIEDKETRKKIKECKVCGFFVCPNCNSCGYNCQKLDWKNFIKKLIPLIDELQLQKLIDYFEDVKFVKENRSCEFGVPISYAKIRNKNILAKIDGYKIKNENDLVKFKRRLQKVKEKDEGYEFTVNEAREDGHYGQEYRDIFNLCVCLGIVEVIKKKNKQGVEYSIFRICNKGECEYFNKEKLIVNRCSKCNKEFDKEVKFCDVCKVKGEFVETKLKISNKDTCQLPRNEFISKNNVLDEK